MSRSAALLSLLLVGMPAPPASGSSCTRTPASARLRLVSDAPSVFLPEDALEVYARSDGELQMAFWVTSAGLWTAAFPEPEGAP